jgi:hypothetical protein
MDMRKVAGLLCILALLAPAAASSATKIDEGFATLVRPDGEHLAPANRVSRASAGDDVFYWVQWKDHPVGRSTLRCVVKDAAGKVIVDESETYTDSVAEGYSICALDTDVRGFEGGSYQFALYLDGELAAERSLPIEKKSFFGKIGLVRQFKWALGGLAAIGLAIYWVRKKMQGDHEGAAEVFAPAADVKMARDPVVIGARLAAEALSQGGGTFERKPQPPDPADQLAIFKKSLCVDPGFRPSRPEDALPIAKAARAAGDPHTAVAALRGFDKAHPGHALIPEVYFFSAKLMAEDLNNAEMAKKVLAHILQKYPGHHVAPEAKRYLQSMPQSV